MPNAGSQRQSGRRIMRSLKINEISAVDRPAQEGARAVIMKRRGSPGYDPENPDPRKRGRADPETDALEKDDNAVVLLTSAEDGHTHAVWVRPGMRGGNTSSSLTPGAETFHDHPWVMDREGRIVIGENDGHTHDVEPDEFVQALMAMASSAIANEVAEQIGKRTFTSEQREQLADEGKALPDGSFPIVTTADLRNAISAFGRASNKAQVARHIQRRARALGATDLLPEEGRLAGLLKDAGAAGDGEVGAQEEDPMTDKTTKSGEGKSDLEKAQERNAQLEAELAETKALAEMDDAQKAYFSKLDTELEDDKRQAFVKAKPEERAAIVKRAEEEAAAKNDVVYEATDGTKYTKADDQRIVALAKRNDELAKALSEQTKAANEANLRKRAETELSSIPGTVETRIEMLRAVDGIEDEGVRKAALESLRAQNAAMAKAFVTVGAGGGNSPEASTAEQQLEELAKRHAEDKGVPLAKAYDAVIQTEEGRKLYAEYTGDNKLSARDVN